MTQNQMAPNQSALEAALSHKKVFIPFVTCGDPDIRTTAQVIRALARAGADAIELGIPFSDPTAEGPVIMEANARALAAHTTTDDIFDLVESIRVDVSVPLVFMTYANVVFSYGIKAFCERAARVGVQGLILPDVPFEEKAEFASVCQAYGLDLVSMIAPTSAERIEEIAREARGFLYVVSSLGVTGVRSEFSTHVSDVVEQARQYTDIPAVVGFGISNAEQAQQMAKISDGAIVGSAIVRLVAEHGKAAPEVIEAFAREIAEAVHGVA